MVGERRMGGEKYNRGDRVVGRKLFCPGSNLLFWIAVKVDGN